jgi:hypothetical protein
MLKFEQITNRVKYIPEHLEGYARRIEAIEEKCSLQGYEPEDLAALDGLHERLRGCEEVSFFDLQDQYEAGLFELKEVTFFRHQIESGVGLEAALSRAAEIEHLTPARCNAIVALCRLGGTWVSINAALHRMGN